MDLFVEGSEGPPHPPNKDTEMEEACIGYGFPHFLLKRQGMDPPGLILLHQDLRCLGNAIVLMLKSSHAEGWGKGPHQGPHPDAPEVQFQASRKDRVEECTRHVLICRNGIKSGDFPCRGGFPWHGVVRGRDHLHGMRFYVAPGLDGPLDPEEHGGT